MKSNWKFNPITPLLVAFVSLLGLICLLSLNVKNAPQEQHFTCHVEKLVYCDDRVKIFYCGIEEGQIYWTTESGFEWITKQGIKLRIFNTSDNAYFVGNYSPLIVDGEFVDSIPCSYKVFAHDKTEELYFVETINPLSVTNITMSLLIQDIDTPVAFQHYCAEFTIAP